MNSRLFWTLSLSLLAAPAFAHEGEEECHHDKADVTKAAADKDAKVILRGEKVGEPTVALADLLRAPEAQNGKTVTIEGSVRHACEKAGCWMELAGDKTGPGVRITLGKGLFVPLHVAGGTAKVKGAVKVVALSDAEVAHLSSEGGKVTKDAKGHAQDVQIVAVGYELHRTP